MGVNENLTFENFIRDAFSMALGRQIERWGDPAGLANTDIFSSGGLHEVKASVSYSMCIWKSHFRENHYNHPVVQDPAKYNRMDTIIADVLNASDKMSVHRFIEEFNDIFNNPILR